MIATQAKRFIAVGACLVSMMFFGSICESSLHAQTLETVFSFPGTNGSFPQSLLVQASNGALYGTTRFTSSNLTSAAGYGTVFKITTNGALSTLFVFESGDTNGRGPQCGLVLARDGNLYGTTVGGASQTSYGPVVFRVTPDNDQFRKIADISTNDQLVFAPLIQARDGRLYGVSSAAGTPDHGRVFNLAFTGGVVTRLATFYETNGSQPKSRLLETADGNLYGTTWAYGLPSPSRYGTIFRLETNGVLSPLVVTFNVTNGSRPVGGLLQASNGKLYGTTSEGGSNNLGTVFELTITGGFKTLATFNGPNGANPQCDLLQAKDGNLYGVTYAGGASNLGTVFKLTLDGRLETLVTFTGTNGAMPFAGLMQAIDGHLYGTTQRGGPADVGTIFRLKLPSTDEFFLSTYRSEGNFILRWPTNGTFILETATNLTRPVAWTNPNAMPTIVGTNFEMTNLPSAPAQFYRLKRM